MPPVLFPFDANAADVVAETLEWLTDVRAARSGDEQRISLREVPRGAVEFSVLADAPRDAALLESLIYRSQPAQWAVPLWPYARTVGSALAGGATSVPADTSLPWSPHPLVAHPYAVVWADPFTCELLGPLTAFTGGALTLPAGLSRAYAASAVVAPCRLGRLPTEAPLERPASELAGARLRWRLEDVGDGGTGTPSGPGFSAYLGTTVLDWEPDRDPAAKAPAFRSYAILDPGPSLVTTATRYVAARPVRGLTLSGATPAAVATLRSFLYERRGRYAAFWLPAWESSLTLSAGASSGATSVVIRSCGYAAGVWPPSGGRRHLRFRSPAGATFDRKVTSAVDNGNGTETLGLAALPQAITTSWRVEYLLLSRLDSDAVTLEWSGQSYLAAKIEARELPMEAPL